MDAVSSPLTPPPFLYPYRRSELPPPPPSISAAVADVVHCRTAPALPVVHLGTKSSPCDPQPDPPRCPPCPPPPPNVTVLQPAPIAPPMLSYLYQSGLYAAAAAQHALAPHRHLGQVYLNAPPPTNGIAPLPVGEQPFPAAATAPEVSLSQQANHLAAAAAAAFHLHPAWMLGSQMALNPWLYPSYLAAFGPCGGAGALGDGLVIGGGGGVHSSSLLSTQHLHGAAGGPVFGGHHHHHYASRFAPYAARSVKAPGGTTTTATGGISMGSPRSPQVPDTSCTTETPPSAAGGGGAQRCCESPPGQNAGAGAAAAAAAPHHSTGSSPLRRPIPSYGTRAAGPSSELKNMEQMLNGLNRNNNNTHDHVITSSKT